MPSGQGLSFVPTTLQGPATTRRGPRAGTGSGSKLLPSEAGPPLPLFHVLPPGLGRVDSWASEAWSWTGDGDAQQTVQRTLAELRPQPKETHSQQALGT